MDALVETIVVDVVLGELMYAETALEKAALRLPAIEKDPERNGVIRE